MLNVNVYDFRAMALCFVLMFGRIGAITGSNIVAQLLEHHCDYIFVVNTTIMIGKEIRLYTLVVCTRAFNHLHYLLFAVGAGMCFVLLRKTSKEKTRTADEAF